MAEAWSWILGAFGAIVVIGGALTYIGKVIKPAREVLRRLDAHDRMLDNDSKRFSEFEAGNKAFCKALLALLDHNITGNSVDKIKDARDALNKYLIDR